MTTITDAHRAEARRRLYEDATLSDVLTVDILAQALAEPAWQPPVDPDLIEARECAALAYEADDLPLTANDCRQGWVDESHAVQSALIAIKRSKANG